MPKRRKRSRERGVKMPRMGRRLSLLYRVSQLEGDGQRNSEDREDGENEMEVDCSMSRTQELERMKSPGLDWDVRQSGESDGNEGP
jgi:hypothetical protein